VGGGGGGGGGCGVGGGGGGDGGVVVAVEVPGGEEGYPDEEVGVVCEREIAR